MANKVFIVSNTAHDYSSAERYGEIVFMHEGKINVFASDKLMKDLEEKLAASKPDDYMILSGNQLAAAMAFSIFMKKHGQVNALLFSFKDQIYELRTIRDRGQGGGNA